MVGECWLERTYIQSDCRNWVGFRFAFPEAALGDLLRG